MLLALGAWADGALARYASIVIEYGSGRTLHEKNADTKNYPASLTKIMTLYMTFQALESGKLSLYQDLPVSKRAAGMPASKLGLGRGQTIKVQDAILALVTKSANDVAVVLAEALGGSEKQFAKMMTAEARKLGMQNTTFRNASGLPNRGQLSSARDMSILAIKLLDNYPQYYHYFATRTFSFKSRSFRNHNKLLRSYKGTDGIKTGYIRASGYNLVASTVRGGRRLIAVVFGGKTGKSRDTHMKKLLNSGFARAAELSPLPLLPPPPRKPGTALVAEAPKPAPKVEPKVELAVAPTPKPQSQAVLDGHWGIQVGAYYRQRPAEEAALRAAQRFPELLGTAEIVTPQIKGDRGTIYRARLIGLNEPVARTACQRLEAEQVDCLVVQAQKRMKVASNPANGG